jgi:hypothetical protein
MPERAHQSIQKPCWTLPGVFIAIVLCLATAASTQVRSIEATDAFFSRQLARERLTRLATFMVA